MAANEDRASARARLIQGFRDSSARQGDWMARQNQLVRRQAAANAVAPVADHAQYAAMGPAQKAQAINASLAGIAPTGAMAQQVPTVGPGSPQSFMAQAGQMIASGAVPPVVAKPPGSPVALQTAQAAPAAQAGPGTLPGFAPVAPGATQAQGSAYALAPQAQVPAYAQAAQAQGNAFAPTAASAAQVAQAVAPAQPNPTAQLASAVQAAHQPAGTPPPAPAPATPVGPGAAQPPGWTSGDVAAALRAAPPPAPAQPQPTAPIAAPAAPAPHPGQPLAAPKAPTAAPQPAAPPASTGAPANSQNTMAGIQKQQNSTGAA